MDWARSTLERENVIFRGGKMGKVAIVTDTDCSLPVGLTDKYGIQQVPIIIQFGDESFRDVFDLDCARVFERIDREGKFPSTSAPSPGAFAEAYKKAFLDGADSVLCLTVSSALSATYQAALNAKDELPGANITVVDTFSLAIGEGFQVLAAAETLAKGGTLDDAISAAQKVKEKTHLYMALATLKYLAMSGRVTYLRALLGNMLDMRPILTIQNGKLELLERTRSEKKA
jgi:DegV family protein with EDD domain